MMTKRVAICIILASVIFSLYILIGGKITLVVLEPITVVTNLDDTLTGKPKNVISIVPVGEHLQVIGCADTKSLIVPQVRLSSGEIGYVFYGRFELIREPGWSSLKEFNAFGC